MKNMKKIIALVLAFVMVVLPCVPANASASVSMNYSTGHAVASGVQYSKYSTYGSSSGHTEETTVLEFHPDDGYIPMAFAAWSGSAGQLSSTYSQAVSRYGYEVVGVINGSFFDMETGMLTGVDGGGALLASGGKLSNYSFGLYSYGSKFNVVAFGGDGSMTRVESQLAHNVYFNGEYVENALRGVNVNQNKDTWRPNAIFYFDQDCGTTADSAYGYEIVCEKVDGTDLRIGEKMVGKVVSVKGYTSGSSIGENQFVLNTPSNSDYVDRMKALKVGDTVEIEVFETVTGSQEVMNKAYSVITDCGMLVKDGVDLTDSQGTIGGHSVYTYARWTVFGQKADGTVVFMTTEGGDTGTTSRSLNLKDVAAAMIELGCVNVYRMDGGGSTGMYVSNTGSGSAGYVMSSSRAVADAMLIVRKTGAVNLRTAIAEAGSISHTDYTATELKAIRECYAEAVATYNSSSSTNEQKQAVADKLNSLVKRTGPVIENGDQFWLTHYNTLNNEGSGAVMTDTYTGGAWWLHVAFSPVAGTSAYEITAISNGLSNGSGSALAIPSGGFVYALNLGNSPYNSAAVQAMVSRANQWKVGDQFIFNGLDLDGKKVPTTTSSTNWYNASYVCTAVMAPYVPSTDSGESNVSNGVYITGFNSSILGGNATIFTSDFNGDGLITGDNANHLWTQNVVLRWDYSVGAYVVTSVTHGNGAGNTPNIQLKSGEILIAVHNDGGTSTTNHDILAQAKVGQVMNVYGLDVASRTLGVAPYVTITDRVDSPLLYQRDDNDNIRLVAYVDDYEAYSSVTFSLIYDGEESKAVKCTTAYAGLYANGELYTTKDIYGKEGYFVALTIEDYMGEWTGEEMTFVATYTTVTGETIRESRTLIID